MKFKFFHSKRSISIFSAICVLSVATIVASVSTVIAHNKVKNKVYYKFDGKVFNSNQEIMDYANSKAQKVSYTTENNYFTYNDKSYGIDENSKLKSDLLTANPLKEVKTYRNPAQYIINSASEVSNQVLTNTNEKLGVVYKGKDGNAYLNKDEAIKTYEDYQKVYKLGNINDSSTASVEFNNKYEAIQYLENVVKPNINENNKTSCYQMAGTCLTRDQISDWIKSTTDIEYDYNGYKFSQLHHPDLSQMKLTEEDKAVNIREYKDFKNSFWLNIDTSGMRGSLTGTQYIETNDTPQTVISKLATGWVKTSGLTMNYELASLVMMTDIINLFMNQSSQHNNDFDVKRDLFNNDKLKYKKLNDLFSDANNYADNFLVIAPIKKSLEKLKKIKGMPTFYKTLIFLQRIYQYTLLCNHLNKEKKALEFENFLKETLKNLINQHAGLFAHTLDKIFEPSVSWTGSDEELSIPEIIHLFLNPAHFAYSSPSKQNLLQGILQDTQAYWDNLFGTIQEAEKEAAQGHSATGKAIEAIIGAVSQTIDQGSEFYDENGKLIEKTKLKEQAKNLNTLLEVTDDISHFVINSAKIVGSILNCLSSIVKELDIVKSIWEITQTLSPVSYVTYKCDLGDNQVLYYSTTEYKIPLVGITLFPDNPGDHFQVTPVFTGMAMKVPEDNQNTKYYTVLGSIFDNEEKAEDYLKHYIIRNPEDFKIVKEFYITIMGKNDHLEVKKDQDKVDNNPNQVVAERAELDKFVDYIFDRYFKTNVNYQYFDGINEFFDNALDAVHSLENKITASKFVIKYKFIDNSGIARYYDSLAELKSVEDNYIENTYLTSKTILTTDLVKTITYDRLEEQLGNYFKVYSVLFNGVMHYFLTNDDAYTYLYNHANIAYHHDKTINYYVYFGPQKFNSPDDFYMWIQNNTTLVNDRGEVITNGN
ncbi:hypothetical protein [Spiroplasma sp. DGKH1]|uniref:hypothetical protein n=1 Tax=Spiroplasma sp. DGKH1 TaxID=3050074 RepID=UPI0034C6A10A